MVLSPDGTKLYVTCAAPRSTVCVIEADSGRVVELDPRGPHGHRPGRLARRQAALCLQSFQQRRLGDRPGGRREIARVPVGREPIAAVVTPDGKSVYVANHLPLDRADSSDVAATVTVIDTASHATATIRLPNGSSSVRGICVSPDGKYVYVVHILARYQMPATQLERGWMNTNAMSIIDAAARKLLNTVLLDDVDLGAANPGA